MKLLAVGDSFTYGEELSDLNNAWPYLLGNKLGYTVNNLAKPGSGNTRMIRHAVEQIDNYDLIIIAWSHFARTELADENGFYDIWPGCRTLPHKEFSSWRSDVINYYSKHHNDQYLYNQYLINIILIQQYLKFNNKKYIMLDAFGNNNYRKNKYKKNNTVVDQIDPTYYIGWPTTTMMEWTHGCPNGPGNHFLEQGHEIVADKIYEHIRHFGWIS
jgi:lysophospholipase L1-like esterase